MPPNHAAIKMQFEEEPMSYWIERLDVLMRDNPPSDPPSAWYLRVKRTKELLDEGKVDQSVRLSVTMAMVGL